MTALQGGTPLEVYVVIVEWGEYEDYGSAVEGVFASREAAERHIRSHKLTLALLRDGGTADIADFDEVDAVGTVTRVPVEGDDRVPDAWDYRPDLCKRVGGTWRIPGDDRYMAEQWTVERWEVRA